MIVRTGITRAIATTITAASAPTTNGSGARPCPTSIAAISYEVADWRGHHLSEPPRGYHWVEVNGDYVLAAVATGVILDTLLTQ